MRTTLLAVLPLALPIAAAAQHTTIDAARDARSAALAHHRGAEPGLIGFTDGFESLAPLPTPLDGQFSTITDFFGVPEWGQNTLDGFIAPYAGVTTSPNGTQAIRLYTEAQQTPGQLYFGFWYDFATPLLPGDADEGVPPSRVSIDVYQSSNAQRYRMTPAAPDGVGVASVLWGGATVESDTGLLFPYPGEHIDTFYFLDYLHIPPYFPYDAYARAVFIDTAPAGYKPGDAPPIPINAWYTLTIERTELYAPRLLIDFNDGSGPHHIATSSLVSGHPLLRGLRTASSFDGPAGATAYFDNLTVSGSPRPVATPPALACDYLDDLSWFPLGEAYNVSQQRWSTTEEFRTSATRLFEISPGDTILRQFGVFDSYAGQYQQALSTELPAASATTNTRWKLCIDLRAFGPAARALRLTSTTSTATDNAVARILLGADFAPGDGPLEIDPSVFVQTDPAYTPLDTYQDAPADNAPVVDVDITDTGADWPYGVWNELCIEVADDLSMTIDLNGLRIHEGLAFSDSIDGLAFEFEAIDLSDPGPTLDLDNLRFICATCPGDVNDDGLVDFSDLNAVLSSFGQTGAPLLGDDNADGAVDFTDLNAVLSRFGGCD